MFSTSLLLETHALLLFKIECKCQFYVSMLSHVMLKQNAFWIWGKMIYFIDEKLSFTLYEIYMKKRCPLLTCFTCDLTSTWPKSTILSTACIRCKYTKLQKKQKKPFGVRRYKILKHMSTSSTLYTPHSSTVK